MGSSDRDWQDHLTLHDALLAAPQGFHLFQALRIVEAHYAGSPRFGESTRPAEERVRLGQPAELSFPTSTVAAYYMPDHGGPGRLLNRFFGFFGPHGPLPLHLTEYARNRAHNHRDRTFIDFANMLAHRFTGLFYRAWRSGQPAPSYDRADDPVAGMVSALAGFRGTAFASRDALPDDARRHFAAHFALGQKPPESLVAILSDFFGVDIGLEEFIGTWLPLEREDRWRLGAEGGWLGRSASLGDEVWSRTAKFRLRIGPLRREAYERMLPGGCSLARLQSIVRSYVGDSLDYDVNLVLDGRDVPHARLDGDARLGWTSWIGQRGEGLTARPDAYDLCVTPASGAA